MKERDLLRLSLGIYPITDGIWNYSIQKKKGYDDSVIYRIKELLTGNSFFIHEHQRKSEDEYPSFIYIKLSAGIMIGGLSIHSDDVWDILNDLKFVSRGSFKKFIEKTTISNINHTK